MNRHFGGISLVAATIVAGSLMFSGCGGGGGSPTTVSGTGTTLTGTAVDELILDGVVEVRANSASGSIIGTGRTDSNDGTYTIDVDGFEGVAVVSVTCDANSSLYFPDTNTKKPCPTDTLLYSAAPVEGDGNVTVNVAPSTHVMFMMATEGDANATLDRTKVEKARLATAQIFGTDPIVSDPTEGIYADVIEAFHAAAEEANVSIQELVEEIAEDAADGELGDDSNATAILAQNMQENNVTTPFVEAVENNTTFAPEVPDDAGSLDDVQAAKDFFQSLRTQSEAIIDPDGLFDREAKAMESLLENVTLNGDLAATILGHLGDAIESAIDANETTAGVTLVILPNGDRRDANLTRVDLSSALWSYTITDTVGGTQTQSGSGTITLPAADPSTIDLNGFTTLTFTFDGTLPATKLYETAQSQQSFKADVTMTKTADGAHLDVAGINLSTADGTLLGLKGFKADIGYDFNDSNQSDPITLNYVKLTDITLDGALDANYTATGTLSVGYTLNSSLATNGGFDEKFMTVVDGHVGCMPPDINSSYIDYANGSFTITMEDNGSYTVTTNEYGHFHATIDDKEYQYTDFQNASISFLDGCDNNGTATIDSLWTDVETDMVVGNSGYIPDTMTLEGVLKNVQTGTELDGTIGAKLLNAADLNLSDPNHVDDDPHIQVTVSGTLKRSGLDDMSLNLNYEYNPQTSTSSGTLAYVYGMTTLNATGIYNELTDDGNVSISSGNGLAMTIIFSDGEIDYDATTPLSKDGRVVGTLDNETGIARIKYIDGSFESLQ